MAQPPPLSAVRCFEIYDQRLFHELKVLMDDKPSRQMDFVLELRIGAPTSLSTVLRDSLKQMNAEQSALEKPT